jgi:D-alanyl-D-alanine carboxypeptidase
MQLVKEGKLSLDDTIDKWFPDQPNGDKITVRMLLSHTSGLSEYVTEKNRNDPKWTRRFPPMDALAAANQLGPVDKPGTKVAHYANTNYFVLGMIIEAVTGKSWEQAVRSRIIDPLHLEHTGFVTEKAAREGMLVKGYFKTPNGYISNLEVPNYPSTSTAWANGGVVSSLSDLMTFAGALFDGRLVSKETLAEMATGIADDPDGVRVWGLGGATLKTIPGSFGMGGDAEAYHAFFAGIQGTKYVVAALVNTAEGDVIVPSLMALDYLRSTPSAQQPATPAP